MPARERGPEWMALVLVREPARVRALSLPGGVARAVGEEEEEGGAEEAAAAAREPS